MHQRERDHLEPYGVGPELATEAPKQPASEEELPREEVDCRVDDESPGRSAGDRLRVVLAEVRLPTDEPDHDGHAGDAGDGNRQAASPVAQGEPVAARVLTPGQNDHTYGDDELQDEPIVGGFDKPVVEGEDQDDRSQGDDLDDPGVEVHAPDPPRLGAV